MIVPFDPRPSSSVDPIHRRAVRSTASPALQQLLLVAGGPLGRQREQPAPAREDVRGHQDEPEAAVSPLGVVDQVDAKRRPGTPVLREHLPRPHTTGKQLLLSLNFAALMDARDG